MECEQSKYPLTRDGYMNLSLPYFYKLYKDRTENPISATAYKKAIQAIFACIWKEIIENVWVFTAPNRMGTFCVMESMQASGFYTNWKKSKEKGKKVREFNLHTNGRIFFVRWNKMHVRNRRASEYIFKAYRGTGDVGAGTRGLSQWIQECAIDPTRKDYRANIV